MDRILASWLRRQESDWQAFADQTDLVIIIPDDAESPCRRFVAQFMCKGLIRQLNGEIVEADHFVAGIYFGEDHLRQINPVQMVWMLTPNVWHPNVYGPALCTGHLRPGVGLIDILYQIHSILTYQNLNLVDFLNPQAADWARENMSRFPIDSRPLKRRRFHMEIEEKH